MTRYIIFHICNIYDSFNHVEFHELKLRKHLISRREKEADEYDESFKNKFSSWMSAKIRMVKSEKIQTGFCGLSEIMYLQTMY